MSFVDNVRALAGRKVPRQTATAKVRGDGPKWTLFGNRQRYRRTDVEAWIGPRAIRSTSGRGRL